MKKQLMILTLCLVAVFVSVSAVSAADVYVNTTGDDTTGDGSAVLPFLTIAKGVTTAVSGDTVIIAPGTYTGTGNKNIDINKNINIQGAGENQTIIDLEGSGYAFEFSPSSTVTVKNLTVKNGNSPDYGGAIRNFGATLTIADCTFKDNTAGRDGGAIYSNGVLTITGSTFTANKLTSSGHGGAIYNPYGGTLTINNCNFNNNQATWGAVANYDGICTITNSNFNDNIGINYGGALWNVGTMTVTGCNFINNTANLYGGGAIFQVNNGVLTANFNRFYNNNAPSGDAIYCMAGTVSAENNWWGSNTDPMTITDLIHVDDGSVDINPWLILSIKADPTEIYNTKTSNVMVDLFTDSDGVSHSGDSAKYPSQIPLVFTNTWGSISQAVLNFGTGTAVFTANGGALPAQNPVTITAADSLNPTATVSTTIIIKSAADLYVKVTSNKDNPKVGETFTVTYKLGNHGPDAAKNVTVTLPLPAGFEVSNISGDGQWNYDKASNSITWTLADVPVGDPYLYVSGKLISAGSFIFDGSIVSETFNLNTEGVTPLTVEAATATQVNAATKTVAMQKTGVPLAYLVLAVLLILGGLVVPRRK